MIVREATGVDLRPLVALCNKAWPQLGTTWKATLPRFRDLQRQRHRIIVLWDGKELPAALVAHPIETDRGPGYEMSAFVVDRDRPDRLDLLDAISIYACNIAISEGRRAIIARSLKSIPGPAYGRDFAGMDAEDRGTEFYQTGDAQAIAKVILGRHPEWQLP